MLVNTRYFGEVELDDNKVITFEKGIIGFENLRNFTIMYDSTNEKRSEVSWLQSLEEPMIALPIINPHSVYPGYNAIVEDEVIANLGELTDDNLIVLVTITVPSDLTKMTCNLKAPIIINSTTKKACQVIAENPEYVIKYNIYELVQKLKESKGE